jgi:hypothetical protein
MTRRAADSTLRHPLERQHHGHRRAWLWRCALRGAERIALLVAFALLLGVAFSPVVATAWLRLGLVAVAGALALLAVAARYARNVLTLPAYLERVEARFPNLKSLLRNALDFEGAELRDVSAELAGAVREQTVRQLESADLGALRPKVAARRPALVMAASLALITVVGLVWPARTQRSWATLWNPEAAAPPVRLVVEPGSVTVTPGASLAVRARVWGSERAPRLERSLGEAVEAASEGRDEGGARIWRFDLAQLTSVQEYWVKVAATKSPRYRIDLSGLLSPVSFEIEYRAPSYARLPVQRGTSSRGDLSALRGSQATLVVTFDRDLEALEAKEGASSRRWESLSPRRWRGVVPIDRDGDYELVASASSEENPPGIAREARFRYRVTALADVPPVLMVRTPEGDVDLPTGQAVPLEVLAQDDLGLSELKLQYRTAPESPWTDLPLASFPAHPRDAHVETHWDASALALLPGQSASFRLVVFDDNAVSGRGRTMSPEFQLRFPSLADLYQNVEEHQTGAQNTLERVADQARELQKTLDKMSRQQAPQEAAPGANFERSEELRGALQRQQDIGRQIDQAAQQLQQSTEQAAERNAFDQDLMRKMNQVQQLMQQIQSPEFKEALRKMQQALENLDRRALERQMPEWRSENKDLVENLERTLELLKKLREEEKVQELAQRAEELKAQQDALNQEHEQSASKPNDSKARQDLAQRQKQAGEESKKLGQETKEQASKSADAEKQEMETAAQELSKEAAEAQEQASESSEQGQSSKAQQSGKQASEALSRAAARMKSMAQQSQSEQQQVDLAAVRRAAQDLVSLQRESEGNLNSNTSPRDMADRQTDLSEGTARVADSLFQLSRQTPFISPDLAEALGRAINGLNESGREMGAGNRARGEEAGRNASRSLNQAILSLREAEGAMCDKPGSGKGGTRPNPQKIGNISQQQSQLNQQTRSLAKQLSEQMRLSAGDREQMDRLAREQERIRRELEQVRSDEENKRELLGRLQQTEREMKEVEEALRQGATDGSLEEKQQRILSRLLDAQRSVNRRDFDPERESKPGVDVAGASPAEIPADLLRQSDRFRQDLLKSELDRYPAQYRSFVEAYLRSLNGSRR